MKKYLRIQETNLLSESKNYSIWIFNLFLFYNELIKPLGFVISKKQDLDLVTAKSE